MEKKWLYVAVAALVVVVVAVYVFTGKKPAAVAPVFAPAGQVVAGFPSELLLNHGAAFSTSYSIHYPPDIDQYTAIWEASSSPAAVYNEYLSYLGTQGWTVTDKIIQFSNPRGLSAARGSSTISIALAGSGAGTEVVANYIPISTIPAVTSDALVRAERGTLIAGFPSQLIVASDAVLGDSVERPSMYSNKNALETYYSTRLSLSELRQKYLEYFQAAAWKVNRDDQADGQFSLFASKEETTVSVSARQTVIPGSANNNVSVDMVLNLPIK